MTETPGQPAQPASPPPRRGRPTHWAHRVDEERRQARVRRYRRRRIGALVLVALAAGVVGGYFYLTSDKRVEEFAEQYLEDLLGANVRIGRATFTPTEGLVLEDLVVMPPAPFTSPLATAARVELRIAPLSLVRLAPDVREIVVRRPQINLVLWDEERWNFQALAQTRPLRAVGPLQRPVVVLEGGRIRIVRAVRGVTIYEREMEVAGLVVPSETRPDAFRFQTDVASPTEHLSVAWGEYETRTGELRLEGQASNVALTPALYSSLPAEARRVWDLFEPTGSVNLKVRFDEKEGLRLETELTGVSFAYRQGGTAYRFENLTGRCGFGGTTLALAGVQGLLNGSPARLDGEVWGFDADRLGVDLSVSADHVTFEASRETLAGLTPHMDSLYRVYSPKGPADVRLRVRRGTEADAPLDVSGTVFCRDVEMTYIHFPYRLERLRGTVEFGPEGYVTDGLDGYHGTARIRLAALACNPGPEVEAWVLVQGRDVPLDEDLRAALPARQREAFDQYAPAGLTDVDVEVYREPRRGAQPEADVWMTLKGCRIRYEGFPYEVTDATGEVRLAGGGTWIENVAGRHGAARVTLSGWTEAQDAGPPKVRLEVRGADVPIDEDLMAALPPRERDVLRVFHLSGPADVAGTITRGPETRNVLDYDLGIRLKGVRMIYEPFPFLAEQVTGDLRLSRGTCRIESLAGFNSGARVEARGRIEQRARDYALDLVLTGHDVLLGESLRGALGPQMRAAWSHLAPQGRVDITAHLTKVAGRSEPIQHHVWVTAKDAQARLDFFPYPLEHVSGQLEFVGDEVLLHDVQARTDLTEFVLGGRIAYSERGPDLRLRLQAKGLRLEGPLKDALPGPLQRAFALIRPSGRADLNLERLVYRVDESGTAEAEWFGSAVLDEVSLQPGVKVSDVVGTAEVGGRWTDGRVALQGEMRIQQGKVADKEVRDTRLRMEKSQDSAVVAVRQIEGRFYGGAIEGYANLDLRPGGKYAFDLNAEGVDFERLLREGFRLEHNIAGGRMRATLGLWARGPDPDTAEATGYADIVDARLYELPVMVRVLAALRFAPADRTGFEKARVLYFMRNKRLYLGDVRLQGPAMSLYGAGTMEPDGQLNLVFVTGKRNEDPLIPALAELAEGIRKELLVVLVTGTLAEPVVKTRSLSTIGAPLRELIAMVRAQREREARGEARRR